MRIAVLLLAVPVLAWAPSGAFAQAAVDYQGQGMNAHAGASPWPGEPWTYASETQCELDARAENVEFCQLGDACDPAPARFEARLQFVAWNPQGAYTFGAVVLGSGGPETTTTPATGTPPSAVLEFLSPTGCPRVLVEGPGPSLFTVEVRAVPSG